MPQISVIVPVYKVEKYINRCVDSILAQTYTDFELILVDDGSPDNCGAICDEYAAKDSRIHVIHQKNGGLSAARNAGIDWAFANSESEWLSFIDSDDWVHPKFLELLISSASKENVDMAVCGFMRTNGERVFVDENNIEVRRIDVGDLYCECYVEATVAWNKLYRKKSFRDIRYPVGRIHEDEFTTYKLLFETCDVAMINQPLYAYFHNENGIMSQKWNLSRLDVFDAYSQRLKWLKKRKVTGDVYTITVERYFNYIREFLDVIDKDYPQYQGRVENSIKHKLLFLMLRNREIFPVKQYSWYYELVIPKLMYFYWVCQGVAKKWRR